MRFLTLFLSVAAATAVAAGPGRGQGVEVPAPPESILPAPQARIESLQQQVDALRSDLDAAIQGRLPAPPAEPALEEQLQSLVQWRESMDEQAAAAKIKAAGAPSLKINGRLFMDTAMFTQNDASLQQAGHAVNETDLRLAWITLSGDAFGVTNYRLQFDLVDAIAFQDVFVGVSDLPWVQNVRVGHFKEPFGMDQLIPNTYMTFMERTTNDTGVFVPGRNMGVMAFTDNADENYTCALGLFVAEQASDPPLFQDDNEATAMTTRVTYLPWYDEATEGRGLLHIGAAYSLRDMADDDARLRARPESHLAPIVIDTGRIAMSEMQLVSLESAYVYGPLSWQGEYYGGLLNTDGPGTAYLDGCYGQVSYFLTGEFRPYNRRGGTFSNRVVPHENFFRVRTEDGGMAAGLGAWELAYRCSYTNLNDEAIAGGRVVDNQFGVNWYLTPYMRTMLDYVHSTADRSGVDDGVMHIVQMRAQVDW